MVKTWFLAGRPGPDSYLCPRYFRNYSGLASGLFSFFPLSLVAAGWAAIQLGTNYTNTYGDYMSGVDTAESNRPVPSWCWEYKARSHAAGRVGLFWWLR